MALLELNGVEITFGKGKDAVRVADDVSFAVEPGEIVSLVGESGCGKSVTAMSILGLLPPQGRVTGGSILLEGKELRGMDAKQLDLIRGRDAAMIFQDILYSLNPVLSIGSQMIEGMRKHLGLGRAEAWARAVDLLARTGIREPEGAMRKYPHMLSGGMRQRVMIAMALSCRPKLLIADEPTTALDVTIQLQIMRLLRQLRDETGMAILLITHDIGVVAETADRVVVMYAGQVVERTDIHTLLTSPAHPYTRALLRAVPGLHDARDKRLYAIPGTVPERYGAMSGCRFQERCELCEGCAFRAESILAEAAPGHWTRCGRAVSGAADAAGGERG